MKNGLRMVVVTLCTLLFASMFCFLGGCSSDTYEYVENNDGTVSFIMKDYGVEELEIPAEIDGKRVKEIKYYEAFEDFDINKIEAITTLKKVVIADGIQEIGPMAFSGCFNLGSVEIASSVTSIKSFAFYGCSKLKEINIPQNVTSVGAYAFHVDLINNIVISGVVSKLKGISYVGNWAIRGDSSVTTAEISEGTEGIADSAFFMLNFENVSIPDTVRNIGASAFYKCTNLTTIQLPKNLISIGEYAFFMCEKLENLTIPVNVMRIDSKAFSMCTKLKNIEFENIIEWYADNQYIPAEKLSDTSLAANYLSDTYSACCWKRS